MAGIQIGIASETKAFKQGIETGLIDPLEDAVDALDKLGKSKGPAKLEDGFEDAQDASKKLEREVKDTADTIEGEFKKSYAKMKNSSEDGTDSARRDLGDMKREANSTAKESAASFDGSADSIKDAFQEVAANAFEGFGPAGAAAGLAAAAGIGLVAAAFGRAGESAEELADRTAETFDQMISSQGKYIGQEFILSNLQELLNDTEKVAEATRNASLLGVDQTVVLRAQAGDSAALADMQDALSRKTDQVSAAYAKAADEGHGVDESTATLSGNLSELRAKMDANNSVFTEAATRYETFTKATTDSAFANDAGLKSVDKLTDGVGRLGSGLGRIPKETNPKVKVEYDIDDSKLRAAVNKSYTIDIRGVYHDRQGRRII